MRALMYAVLLQGALRASAVNGTDADHPEALTVSLEPSFTLVEYSQVPRDVSISVRMSTLDVKYFIAGRSGGKLSKEGAIMKLRDPDDRLIQAQGHYYRRVAFFYSQERDFHGSCGQDVA